MRREAAEVLGAVAAGLGVVAALLDAAWLLAAFAAQGFVGAPSEGAVSPQSEGQALV